MRPTDRSSLAWFTGAIAYVLAFALILAAYGHPTLVTLAIGAPFGLYMLWQSLHVDDFRFGQHDEDTPYAPENGHRAAITYRELDRADATR